MTPKHIQYAVSQFAEHIAAGTHRLIITMPPRHLKSTLASTLLPARYLGDHPGEGKKVAVCSRTPYNRPKRESVFSVPWGAYNSRRYDLFILDDVCATREEYESRTMQESAYEWFRTGVLTAVAPEGCVCIVANRWGKDDLIGRCLSADAVHIANGDADKAQGWKEISLPALSRIDDGFRKVMGTPLWSERCGFEELGRLRKVLGNVYWRALYQQSPIG